MSHESHEGAVGDAENQRDPQTVGRYEANPYHPPAAEDGALQRRRSPLGWPAALIATLLVSVAAYILWRAHSEPLVGGCGMPLAASIIVAAFLIAAAIGVVCLDMVIRLME